MFGTKKIRGLAEPIPPDENETIVEHINDSYPFCNERLSTRSFIRIIVWTVLEMKKRGFL
jgi:hypothetical protein